MPMQAMEWTYGVEVELKPSGWTQYQSPNAEPTVDRQTRNSPALNV